MKRNLFVSAAGALLVVAAATAAVSATADSGPHRPSLIVAEGDDLLPSATTTDWVTYSDHLVQVTVTGEHELTATDDEIAAGEGYLPREVDVRVDDVLWSRSGAEAAPTSMQWDLDGWMFHGEDKTPIRLDGEPDISVGDTYLVPITQLSETDVVSASGWSPLSTTSILPYGNGTIGSGAAVVGYSGPESDVGGTTQVRDDSWGKSATDLVSMLAAAQPDPNAKGSMGLPPDQRYRHAMSSDATTG